MKPKNSAVIGSLMAVVLGLGFVTAPIAASAASDPQSAVNAAYAKFKGVTEGKNADYIPALAKVDPNLFGIALVTVDGKVYTAGDINTEVSIQSISKVFTMAQVIQEQGPESIEKRIGVDATGAKFNSITPEGQTQACAASCSRLVGCVIDQRLSA
jgi:glutaminase